MVKVQCCGAYPRGLEPRRRNYRPQANKPNQLSMLYRSVNEYSEATERLQAVLQQANISWIDVHIPSLC